MSGVAAPRETKALELDTPGRYVVPRSVNSFLVH